MKAEEKSLARTDTRLQVLQAELRQKAFSEAYSATLPTTIRRLMPLDRASNIILRCCQKNPKLLDCDPRTIKQALLDSAALGLELGGPLHHAYVVPYYNSKVGCYEAQLQIGFQGFLELARRTGQIDGAPIVQWVYQHDRFVINFADHSTPITHEPYLDGPRGDAKLVYCLVWFSSGGYHFDFMSKSDIDRHRDLYSKKDRDGNASAVWADHYDEMGRKTILRRAAKYWPLSSELAQAIETDEAIERGEKIKIVDVAELAPAEPPVSRSEELAKKLSAKPPVPTEEEIEREAIKNEVGVK